ncbi:hypothetical protein HZS_783 [Henneguya salminicola]|nr:hypothetical protein HZS_783 [Henneguya salminicola]
MSLNVKIIFLSTKIKFAIKQMIVEIQAMKLIATVHNLNTFTDKFCQADLFRCENGQYKPLPNLCDRKQDCNDKSNEMNCNKIFDFLRKGSVNIDYANESCYHICVPKINICHLITQCEDGSDEINCNHTIVCPNKDDLLCLTDFSCYRKEQICDRFPYCSDGSDELNCLRIYAY